MKLEVDLSGPFPLARLAGDWRSTDGDAGLDSLHALVAAPDSRLAIDLSALKMLDSSGLSALINLVTRARLSRSRIVLVAPSPFVAGVFEVTRLDRWFEVCKDLQEAADRLR